MSIAGPFPSVVQAHTQLYSFGGRIKLIICQIRGYHGLNGQLSNRDFSRTTKLILYKTLILYVLLYGANAWTLLSTDAAALRVFERIVLRKIFGPVRVGNDFHIRFNSELYELLNDIDVVQHINIQRLRWLGHVVRMVEDAPARRVFDDLASEIISNFSVLRK